MLAFYIVFRMGTACAVPAEEKVRGKVLGRMFENSEHQEGAGQFYGSMSWKKCRRNYLSLHPICERCNKLGIIRSAEIVHHKIYLDSSSYSKPEISLNFDNLEALCFNCHQAEHYGRKECRDELYFDADGNLRKG